MTATERDRIVVLETKVDGINERLDRIIDDHEERIRCLEAQPGKKWNGASAAIVAAVITGVIGIIIGIFSRLIQ